MRRLWRLLTAFLALLVGARRRRRRREEEEQRIVAPAPPRRRGEALVIACLFLAALCAVGFVYVYATDSLRGHTQLYGLSLGLCFAFLAAALVVASRALVPVEELEEEYSGPHPEEQEAVERIVKESGTRITRKRLLGAAAGSLGGALGAALLAPALSMGPALDVDPLYRTPWRRGRRLVNEDGVPLRAADIGHKVFYTAYPEGADQDQIGAPLIVVRLNPVELRLPADRRDWAPQGILAYSKVCTHAGCAIALYRSPLFPPVEPRPAFVCPCHYSTFDPASGGKVLFGPAGRALPQLPLMIDRRGVVRAAGNFSGPVGPSWWGVRTRRARS